MMNFFPLVRGLRVKKKNCPRRPRKVRTRIKQDLPRNREMKTTKEEA